MSREPKTLTYSRALLDLTVRENGEAMATITRVFAQFAQLFVHIEQQTRVLQQRFPQDAQLNAVVDDCTAASLALRAGLRAVQIHDITDQRLAHIAELLGALADGRECEIASVLTDEEERALLHLIERGVPSHEVFGHLGSGQAARGTVELF